MNMKKIKLLIVLVTLLISNLSFSQFKDCDCSKPIDEKLKTEFTSYDRDSFRTFIYNYMYSNSKARKKMKRSSSFGLDIIVDAIPINFSASSDSKSSAMKSMEQEILRTSEVNNQQINRIIKIYMPNRAFDSYDRCLESCDSYFELINKNGLKISATEESEEIVTLSVEWKSQTDQAIKVLDADYTNGIHLHDKKFFKGRTIKDKQIIIETIKRSKDKDLIIVINFEPGGVGVVRKKFRAPVRRNNENVPIGTIVASVLDYETFLNVNGIKDDNFDIETSTWSPCDGRDVSISTYGKKISKVPDLRGVFLRGINDMGVSGTLPADQKQLNPENKVAGEFQPDIVKNHNHKHRATAKGGSWFKNYKTYNGNWGSEKSGNNSSDITETNENGGDETRPKNITVYYYIRIN